MNLRIRGAGPRDLDKVQKLYKDYNFTLDAKHLELMIVAEDTDTGDIIAIASLVTLLEATFITDKTKSRKDRLAALDACMSAGEKTVKSLGYENYHGFATNKAIENLSKKRYGYVNAEGKNLIKWVE
jgi:hypothetical protein